MGVWVYWMEFTPHWSHERNIHEIFCFAVHDLFDVQGYEVKELIDYGVKAFHF